MLTIQEAIAIAHSPLAPANKLDVLRRAYAVAILATWSASCGSDRYVDLRSYHAREEQARKALDAALAEASDYLPAHC